jgi:hypothetical protein
MIVPLLVRETVWGCPNCATRARTLEPRPHQQFHDCPGTLGLTVPMVPEGTRCKITPTEREDYVGRDRGVQVAPADGRPYMNVLTEHDDGRQDCTVYAPCAIGSVGG